VPRRVVRARSWRESCGTTTAAASEAAGEAVQGEQSGCREDATPTAAEKDESGDESDLLTEDRDRAEL
jgi:hypothetical protein